MTVVTETFDLVWNLCSLSKENGRVMELWKWSEGIICAKRETVRWCSEAQKIVCAKVQKLREMRGQVS